MKRIILFILTIPLFLHSRAQTTIVACEYWMDGDMDAMTEVSITGNEANFAIDVTSLADGMHTLYYRVRDDQGRYSAPNTWLYMKSSALHGNGGDTPSTIVACEYWMDGDMSNITEIAVDSAQVAFAIDVTSLADGMHTLYYRVRDDQGRYSAPNTWLYMKDSAIRNSAESRIVWYKYWWNHHQDKAERVEVECDSTEFVLLRQLDIPDYVKTDGDTCYTSGMLMFMFGNNKGYTSAIDSVEVTFPMNRYTVTYTVDGEVYMNKEYAYGDTLVAEAFPTKEGHTFSGWVGVPETMPAEDVTITGTFAVSSTQTDAQGVTYALNETAEAFVVTGYTEDLVEDIVIPADLYGVPVTSLQDKAFIGVDVLKSVVIPANVTTVGEKAFYGCHNLLVVDWNTAATLSADIFGDTSCNMLVFVADGDTEVNYQGNLVIEGVANQIVLTDELPFRNPRDFVARSISYSREFTKETKVGLSGGWEAMVLPFEVQMVVSEMKGAMSPIGQADLTASIPYWVAEMQEGGAFALTDKIAPNKPFIMEVPNSDEYEDMYNVEGMITFSAENTTVYATAGMTHGKGDGYSMHGSYEGVAADTRIYALNDEAYSINNETYMPGGIFVANSRDIRPFEAYVYSGQVAPAPYLRIGGKGSTGINELTMDNGQLIIYDLQGRKVLNTENLKVGVYIINGKRVLIQ